MGQKLNIMYLLSSFNSGGAEKMITEFFEEAKKHDEANFILVVMNDKFDKNLRQRIENTGYKCIFLNRKEGKKDLKYLFELRKIVKENNVDIIHSHNYGSKFWSMLCKMTMPKLKLFFTIHSMTTFSGQNGLKIFLHNLFIDENIAISDAVQKIAENKGIKRIKRIYNGINTKKYSEKSSQNENFKIINVARVNHKIKGQDVLIEALNECKKCGYSFKCDFVGGIYDYGQKSYEYLKELVQKYGLEDEINFFGNRDDVPELLSKADIFVSASREEGFGLTIVEAMLAKVPVISSDVFGPKEIIKDGTGLFFESENVKDLSDKIILLYQDEKLRNSLVDSAFEYAKNFDIENMFKNYMTEYRKIIK